MPEFVLGVIVTGEAIGVAISAEAFVP